MTNQPIGADITFRWIEEPEGAKQQAYVSFGEYDKENNCSSPDGLNDDFVFYYCSQQELVDMIGDTSGDWVLISIDEYSYGTYEGMTTYGEE